jgi:hypothetical protein
MRTRWVIGLLVTVSSLPGLSQSVPRERYALTEQQVANALVARGVTSADARVSFVAKIVATEPNPLLDVLSVEQPHDWQPAKDADARTWVKLGCHVHGKCLPFYVLVSRAGGAGSSTPVLNTASFQSGEVAMQAGTHATLMLDDNRAHLEVAVISLENGEAGHKIRVASLDHRHFYVAEVVNAQLLKGSF